MRPKVSGELVMMVLERITGQTFGDLAKEDLTDEERRVFAPQMAEIVAYVEQLNEIDTAAIEPARRHRSIAGLSMVAARPGGKALPASAPRRSRTRPAWSAPCEPCTT